MKTALPVLLLFGSGNFCSLLAGFREPNRDRLFATLHGGPAFPTLESALLVFVHCFFHRALRLCSSCGHRIFSSYTSRGSGAIRKPKTCEGMCGGTAQAA